MVTARERFGVDPSPPAVRLLEAATVVLLAAAIFFGGAAGTSSIPVLGSAAVVIACVGLALAAKGRLALPRLDRAGMVAMVALAGLVAWTGLSIVWSIAGDRSWDALTRALVYAAFAALGLVYAASAPRAPRTLALALAIVLGCALTWSLAGVAVPVLFPEGDRIARLQAPVGYWNALALLADAAIPLGLWVFVATRSRGARMAGSLLVYLATVALLLTQSRAGVLAGLAVVALWLGLSPERIEGGLAGVLAAAPAVVVAGWAFTRSALVDDGVGRAARVQDGRVFAVLAVVGAVVVVALADRVPVHRLAAEHGRTVARVVVVAVVAALLLGGVGLVVRVGNPVSWAHRQFSGGECANGPGRLGELCANNRLAWWGEAAEIWRAHRIVGTGASTFAIARLRYRDDATFVTQPHSVPLQLAADTGIVGLLLGVCFVAAAAGGVVRSLGRLTGPNRTAAHALVALPVAFGLHALVDYDLDFLAVSGPAMLVVAVFLGAGRPAARCDVGWLGVAAAGLIAAAVVAVLAIPALASRQVDRAYAFIDSGHLAAAARAADRARSLNPLSLDAVIAAAQVAEVRRDDLRARSLYQSATRLQPENPDTWWNLGLFELDVRDDACAAYFALNRAYTLDPRSRRWTPGGPLDVARDAVNNGACG